MRKIVTAAVSALSMLLVLAACGGGAGLPGDWGAERTFVATAATDAGTPHPLVPGTRIELTLGRDGRLRADAGCNYFSGTAQVTDGHLVVTDLSQTEMGCDPPRQAQDAWLAALLTAKPTWEVAGDELVLTSSATTLRLTDRRIADPDRPLAGTRWTVDTIIRGDAASSVPAGEVAYLELDGQGSFTGSTGCAPISGRATVSSGTLTLTVHDQPTCTGVLPAAVNSVLRGPVTYAITARQLTLTARDGTGLRLTAS